ncbi:hypothetical protein PROFUN_02795 [Planoprotostelium fungivorum]|uniref:Calponin-homology (CH) domain-containing protein n=1 Tax=Planoprotostelium fungivorum TaxID=1890364 RepID=A0A2P6NXM6_9EUKA|nr:hypothetical protein PROFUN_02795 [Planoprotostelium fungivorum]
MTGLQPDGSYRPTDYPPAASNNASPPPYYNNQFGQQVTITQQTTTSPYMGGLPTQQTYGYPQQAQNEYAPYPNNSQQMNNPYTQQQQYNYPPVYNNPNGYPNAAPYPIYNQPAAPYGASAPGAYGNYAPYSQPTQPNYNQSNYDQPNYNQSNYNQPIYNQPNYNQPSYPSPTQQTIYNLPAYPSQFAPEAQQPAQASTQLTQNTLQSPPHPVPAHSTAPPPNPMYNVPPAVPAQNVGQPATQPHDIPSTVPAQIQQVPVYPQGLPQHVSSTASPMESVPAQILAAPTPQLPTTQGLPPPAAGVQAVPAQISPATPHSPPFPTDLFVDANDRKFILSSVAGFLTGTLFRDRVISPLLPFEDDGSKLFSSVADGVLYNRLLAEVAPESKWSQTAHQGPVGIAKITENINAAHSAAKDLGYDVSRISVEALLEVHQDSVLSFLWTIIYNAELNKVNVRHHNSLLSLFKEGEKFDVPPKELLLRWFNFKLGEKGKRPVQNLSSDLTHGESLLVVTSYSGPGPCFGYMSTENEPFATTARYIVNKSKTFLPWQFISQEAIIAGHEATLTFFISELLHHSRKRS